MGCFSYSCQLSGVPIGAGERCVLLPVQVSRYSPLKYDYGTSSPVKTPLTGVGSLISNDGPRVLFTEYCFPIFGEYDDYGGLSNIEHDDNVKVLEDYFECSIEDIVDYLCNVRDPLPDGNERVKELENLSIVWIHRSVYDNLSQKRDEFYDWNDGDMGNPTFLKAIGFKYIGEDSEEERYKYVYENNGVKIKSDNSWVHTEDNKSLFTIRDFKHFAEKNKLQLKLPEEPFTSTVQIYDYIIPVYSSLLQVGSIADCAITQNVPRIVSMLLGGRREAEARFLDETFLLLEESGTYDNSPANKAIKKAIKNAKARKSEKLYDYYFKWIKKNYKNNFLRKNILEWEAIVYYYIATGRYFAPIGTSFQWECTENTRNFAEAILAAVTKKDETNANSPYSDGLITYSLKDTKSRRCSMCERKVSKRGASFCTSCYKAYRQRNIPSAYRLLLDKKELKYFTVIGDKYGVSDNSIRNWFKIRGIL